MIIIKSIDGMLNQLRPKPQYFLKNSNIDPMRNERFDEVRVRENERLKKECKIYVCVRDDCAFFGPLLLLSIV